MDKRKRTFTKEQEDTIAEIYQREGSIIALSRQYKASQVSIKRVLELRNIPIKDNPYYSTSAQIDESELVRLYEEEYYSMEDLKAHFRTNHRRVKRILLAHGLGVVPRKSVKHISPECVDDILTYFYGGLSLTEICQRVGVGAYKVKEVLNDHGIIMRGKGELNIIHITPEEASKMKRIYDETLSLRLVGREFGFSPPFVKEAIKRYYPDFEVSTEHPSTEQIWMYEHGIRKGRKMFKELMSKIADERRGKPGPRPSPGTFGRGVSGWYRDLYFRSLKELSFILKYEKEHEVESAEAVIRVKYKDGDRFRHYYPDFILDKTIIVEVKCIYQRDDRITKAKMKALKRYCKTHGYTCRFEDAEIDHPAIKNLYREGKVVFSTKNEEYVKLTYDTDEI